MKAAIRSRYGGPEVLSVATVPTPEPAGNEIQVRVHAATVNRTDCGVLWGRPWIIRFFTGLFRPELATTGTDFAGEVTAVGSGVTTFRVGDRVWGFDDSGLASHAEYLTVAADRPIGQMPRGIGYREAAAALEGAHYARNFIDKVDLGPGSRVLVNGATGAIGSAAVQLLKARDVYVTAVGPGSELEKIRALGADRVIDYTRTDFTRDEERYDGVFDAVGKSTFFRCRRLLEPGGFYISSELGPWMQNPWLALFTPLFGGKQVKFPFPTDHLATLRTQADLIERKQFRPLIDRIYPLEEIRAAYDYVASGQKIGNVILEPGPA